MRLQIFFLLVAYAAAGSVFTLHCANNFCPDFSQAPNYIVCPQTFIPSTDSFVIGAADPSIPITADGSAAACFQYMGPGSGGTIATYDAVNQCLSYEDGLRRDAIVETNNGLFLNQPQYFSPCAQTGFDDAPSGDQFQADPACVSAPSIAASCLPTSTATTKTKTHTHTHTHVHTHTHTHMHTKTKTKTK